MTTLISLGREIPVDLGGTEGFIDDMLVTDDGQLVIVETKLWRNPESTRSVIAQTLQYGMAVSQLSPLEFEERPRRSNSQGARLGPDETVAQYVQNLASSGSTVDLVDDFEDAFDRMRRAGEVLLLIVAYGIRPSVERLVNWMNDTVGSKPYKLGLIELCLYDLAGAERIVVPRTLLRIREASRHVVSINLQGIPTDKVTVAVAASDGPPEKRKIAPPGIPLTEERLTELIQAGNSSEFVEVAEQLRARLKKSSLSTRAFPSEIQYGVQLDGDFVPLVHLMRQTISFMIPTRAARNLGVDRFVECKRMINKVADFYRSLDVNDPPRVFALMPRYGVLTDKVEDFVDTVEEIAEMVRSAMEQAS